MAAAFLRDFPASQPKRSAWILVAIVADLDSEGAGEARKDTATGGMINISFAAAFFEKNHDQVAGGGKLRRK